MTGLPDLPPELLLRIARHFRSNQSPPERAATERAAAFGCRRRPYDKKTKAELHPNARSLLRLSSTCRAFKSVLEPEQYYLITNFNLKCSSAVQKLLYLLALLQERPQIRRWIKQLHLLLPGSASNVTSSLEPANIRFLRRKALALGGAKLERNLMEQVEKGEQATLYATILALLAVALLRDLGNARGISVMLTSNIFKRVVGVLGGGQDPPQTIFLPKLTSFVVIIDPTRPFAYEYDTWSSSLVNDWEKARAVRYAPLLSGLWVERLPQCVPLHRMPEARCKHLRSISLIEVFIPAEELKPLLARCEWLETFKYSYLERATNEPRLPSPRHVQNAVRTHGASLRTLYFETLEDWSQDENFGGLRDRVRLENLCVDTGSFPPMSMRPRSLPKSLRRLHITGYGECLVEGLLNLASMFTRDTLPALEEVAYGDCGCGCCRPPDAPPARRASSSSTSSPLFYSNPSRFLEHFDTLHYGQNALPGQTNSHVVLST